jgi:uncharacterized membrane protein (TIGR02234 family)
VITRLLTKRNTFVILALPTLLLLLVTTRTWATGRTTDPVLGQATVSVTGSQAAPGVVALGAVALAALVPTVTGGPRIRRLSAVILTLAAAGATVLSTLVVADPAQALGRRAAEQLGRTGAVGSAGAVSLWPWSAVVLGAALTLAGGLATVAAGRWDGLSSRFDRPDVAESTDSRGARRSTWDELSDGHDPTVGQEEHRT